jgi:hypothetical protein
MAIEIQFKCSRDEQDYVIVNQIGDNIWLTGIFDDNSIEFVFNIKTAIKLSKTIRTEINKAKEVNNG